MSKLKTIDIMKKIQQNLKTKNQIEYKIVALREYFDPRLILSDNPIIRSIKKIVLFILSPFLNSQIIFNRNTTALFEELYKYIEHLERRIKSLEKSQK